MEKNIMKIAMIGQKGLPAIYGGVEKHVHDLAVRLVLAGHEVTAYSRKWYTKGTDELFKGVKIKHLPSIHTKHLDAISHTFLATLDAIKNKAEIIHYHGIGPSLLSWMPRILAPRARVIVTFHSIDRYHQKWNFLARFILRWGEWTACHFPHATIAVSHGIKNYCFNEFQKNVHYIPNGFNTQKKVIDNNSIADFGLEKNNYLIMVSRLIPHKGAHILIEAFNKIKKQYPDNTFINNLKLAIVGGSVYTDKYVKKLHLLAGETNDIIFTDFQDGENLRQLYAHANVLVHPSLNEGLPITVIEAMASGKPVLVSNLAEHRELINDPKFIFPENDVDELAKKIMEFINLSAEEKNQAVADNLKMVEKYYNWDKLVPEVLRVYNKE